MTHYRIEAQIIPDQHVLRAGADVTFVPLDATRSVVFELNGSLKVESIEKDGKALTGFVQDAVGVGSLGPSVRIDLGQVVPANQPVTLRIRWSGALVTPEGGPLATKRLAYVGNEGSYLMYASRWFPFMITLPTERLQISRLSCLRVCRSLDQRRSSGCSTVAERGRCSLSICTPPASVDRKLCSRPVHQQEPALQQLRPSVIRDAGQRKTARSLRRTDWPRTRVLHEEYGKPLFGNRLVVVQIDDESLDTYSGPGMIFLSSKMFDTTRPVPEEKIQREIAYQWWGQTVGLKSFDDAWLSQGLAEWSAFAFRESTFECGRSRRRSARATGTRADVRTNSIDRARAERSRRSIRSLPVDRLLQGFDDLSHVARDDWTRKLRSTACHFPDTYRGKNASIDDFEKLATKVSQDNLRYFFAQWVEGTGVPEFTVDYQIIRTRSGKFRTRGTVKQNLEALHMPVELLLRAEGDNQQKIVRIEGRSEDFDFESNGQPLEVVVDPNNKILRMSEDLRVSIIARRGIEQMKEGIYAEAQQQFEAALEARSFQLVGLLQSRFAVSRTAQLATGARQSEASLIGNLKPAWIEVWAHIKRGNAYDAKGERRAR